MNIAIIFDMDGVIVANDRYHVEAWLEFARRHGAELTPEYYRKNINGRTMAGCLEVLFGRKMSAVEVKKYGEEKEGLYREIYRPHLAATPGLQLFLEELKAREVPCAVATSAPRANVDFTLDGTGLRHFFRQVIDDSGVTRGKPDPEVYLKSASGLGIAPERCVVFEDALLGIEAGKNAGMKVVGVATTHPEEELGQADRVIKDFEGLNVEELLEWVEASKGE